MVSDDVAPTELGKFVAMDFYKDAAPTVLLKIASPEG
jgi:hypothetical protein